MPPAPSTPLDTITAIATPEHIAFEFHVVGPLMRGIAWLIDTIIYLVLLFFIALFFGLIFFTLAPGMIFIVGFLLYWFGGALCEWLWKGFTPGKAICRIRVVDHRGLPPGPGPAVLRNLFRGADFMPMGFLLGLACMCCNRRFQRLGDLVAGTMVVAVQRNYARKIHASKDEELLQLARELPPAIDQLDGTVVRALATFVERRARFGPARREEMAGHLAPELRRRFGIERPRSDDRLLCTVYVRCFQLAGEQSDGRALEVLRRRQPAWSQLERQLTITPRKDSHALTFDRLYRDACADLALAEAQHLPEGQVRYLHDLIGRAHRRFYARRRIDWRGLWDQVWVQVPGRLYGDACTRLGLACFFLPFIGCALVGWQQPALVAATMGPDMVDQLHEMYAEAPRGREFFAGSFMTGFYIQHNASIALSSFVAGIFLGVGSAVYLLFNGLMLGMAFGYMLSVDPATRAHFFEFVAAHGPFELTGIALAGAAGLRLGLGILVREGLPLGDAMRRAAGRALPMALVAATFVAMAAPIEGFISPSHLPVAIKVSTMLLSALALAIYLVGFGARGRRILAARADAREQVADAD